MKFLIAYSLKDSKDYELDLIPNAIYKIDQDATNCFDNVWLVSTTANTSEIKKSILKHLSPADKILVSTAGDTEFAGFDSAMTVRLSGDIDE